MCRWVDALVVDASWIKKATKTRDLSQVIFMTIQDSELFEEEKKQEVGTEVSYMVSFG